MKKIAGSLDTNVLLRLLLNDIPEQHAAAKRLIQEAESQLVVTDIAMIELVFVLERYYVLTREQVGEAVMGIVQLNKISANRALFEAVLPLYIDHPALSFEDCCLSAYAKLTNAQPLWTFDKKLARQAGSAELVEIQ